MLDLELASQDSDIVTIDLHEYENPVEAMEYLETELYSLYKSGTHFVKVIHGVGTGVMSGKVGQALKENPLVERFLLVKDGGSTMLVLSRNS